MAISKFDYNLAFSRNIGWVTEQEQKILQHKRVAIAGMGGVGGSHLLTLTRLGIGGFKIADFDHFELANFNRQAGATTSSLDKAKVDRLFDMAKDINPQLEIEKFPQGVSIDNLDAFFEGVDIYVDGLDFFVFEIRQAVFKYCYENGIPAVTAAPIGMGTAVLNFLPGQMSFEDYFGFAGHSKEEKGLRFILGLAPKAVHAGYLIDPSRLDMENQTAPSTPMGCELCAGAAATQVLKILLGRGDVLAAPYGMQFDAYKNKLAYTWRPGGHKNPLQKISLNLIKRMGLPQSSTLPVYTDDKLERPIDKIIDAARWAPSGDNMQTWRFEIVNDQHLIVHGFDTEKECIYDIHGNPSKIAIGALLENIDIAAEYLGYQVRCERQAHKPDSHPTFDVYLSKAQSQSDKFQSLYPYITVRTVQRRSMRRDKLTPTEKQILQKAVGESYQVLWIDGWKEKLRVASLLFMNGKIRLTMPEAFSVHRSVIEWNAKYSEDKIPDQAVGMDGIAVKMMKWALESWDRVKFLNTFMAGTIAPRVQLDFIPGVNCGAHFLLIAEQTPSGVDDYINAGRALQRFWLTATRLNLQLQPEMTPIIFAGYVREGIQFTEVKSTVKLAEKLTRKLSGMIGESQMDRAVFMGRVGHGLRAEARSLRLPLKRLMKA